MVRIDGDDVAFRYFPREALQVVVPPEPQWQVGDALRIDGETYTLELNFYGIERWFGATVGITPPELIQRAWSEGRVRVLYCQKEESHE